MGTADDQGKPVILTRMRTAKSNSVGVKWERRRGHFVVLRKREYYFLFLKHFYRTIDRNFLQ